MLTGKLKSSDGKNNNQAGLSAKGEKNMIDLGSLYSKNPQPFFGDLILNKKLDTINWPGGRVLPCLAEKCQSVYNRPLSQCTLYDLVRIPEATVRRTAGMGEITFRGIEDKLREFGLHVGMTETDVEIYRICYGTADFLRMHLGADDARKTDERSYKEILDIKVSDVDWKETRARNGINALCLNRLGKKSSSCTLRELVGIDDDDFIRTRSIGRKTIPLIRSILKEMGLHMGMTSEEIEALCYYEEVAKENMNTVEEKEDNGVSVEINCHGGPLPNNQGGKGDWYDMFVAEDVDMKAGEFRLISMGISIRIPKGYTAYVLPRSSTFKKFGILQTNSMGVIDSSFSGDGDIIRFPALATRDTHISKGDRIAQITIMPTVKINWKPVEKLDEVERGCFGSTGI